MSMEILKNFDFRLAEKEAEIEMLKRHYIEVLQEIWQEISEKAHSFQCMKRIDGEMVECEEKEVDLEDVLKIIDTHIKEITNETDN